MTYISNNIVSDNAKMCNIIVFVFKKKQNNLMLHKNHNRYHPITYQNYYISVIHSILLVEVTFLISY